MYIDIVKSVYIYILHLNLIGRYPNYNWTIYKQIKQTYHSLALHAVGN